MLVGSRHVRIHKVDRCECEVFFIENLQAGRCSYPDGPETVFKDCRDEIAGYGIAVVPVEMESGEIHSVKARQAVLGRYPDESPAVLINVVYAAVGKSGTGCVQSRHLAVNACSSCQQKQGKYQF